MTKYPLIERLISRGVFGPDHAAKEIDLSWPIIPALEYFLSLENVTGFSDKLDEIIEKPVGQANKNDRSVQWASLCAEIGAICLLGKMLGLRIVGFEQISPKTTRPKANCDVLVVVNGNLKFCEVKRNAAEEKQILPDLLQQKLNELELPYSITPELIDRNYDCTNLNTKLQKLIDHVTTFEEQKHKGSMAIENSPASFNAGEFIVYFHPKSEVSSESQFLTPVLSSDLSNFMLGPGGIGRDGKPMVPMVQQAILKGADYLICRVTGWEGWPKIVEKCFERLMYSNGATYFIRDQRFGSLDGIILFSHYNDFCIVNNLKVKEGNWLVA